MATQTFQLSKGLYHSVLANGFQVVTQRVPVQLASVGLWVASGTRHEPRGKNGIAHGVEHMVYLGAKNHTERQIVGAFESGGGNHNAGTHREYTCYYAWLDPTMIPKAVHALSDMTRRPVFENGKLDAEMDVIRKEIKIYEDSPADGAHALDLWHLHAFPRQNLGRLPLGTTASLARITRADLLAYKNRMHVGRNMVLVGTGQVDHRQLLLHAEENFGGLPPGERPSTTKPNFKGGFLWQRKNIEQTYITIGYPGPSAKDPSQMAAQFLAEIHNRERLFPKVRQHGLSYGISSHTEDYADTGVFYIQGAADSQAGIVDLVTIIGKELQRNQTHLSMAEVERTRRHIVFSLKEGCMDLVNLADMLGRETITLGKPISLEESLRQSAAVTRETMLSTARNIFRHPPFVVAIGPELPDIDKIFNSLGFAAPQRRLTRA